MLITYLQLGTSLITFGLKTSTALLELSTFRKDAMNITEFTIAQDATCCMWSHAHFHAEVKSHSRTIRSCGIAEC